MFERFTDRAKKVVTLAHAEARSLDHDYIGTEHLLLGLISEGESVAARALESVGVSLDAVRGQVEEITGRGKGAPSGHMPFTPRAKKVLELSLREALQLGHHSIGPEHILLGLVGEGQGVAADVLARLGADLSLVRQQVRRLLGSESDEPAAAAQRARVRPRIPARVTRSDYAVSEPSLYDMLTSMGERLTAIERRLGMPGVVRQEGGVPERGAREPARTGTEETAQLRAEVTRLQALLQQHGIDRRDPGDPGDPAAVLRGVGAWCNGVAAAVRECPGQDAWLGLLKVPAGCLLGRWCCLQVGLSSHAQPGPATSRSWWTSALRRVHDFG